MTVSLYACHGLGFIQPIDEMAQWLRLQLQLPVKTVGGSDPMLEQAAIVAAIGNDINAKRQIIFIGHSKGAMLGFYLPDCGLDLSNSMIVTIDPTCWGSNISAAQWSLFPEFPGQWKAKQAARWLNFTSGSYPGGGRMINPNETTYRQFSFTDDNHMSIVNDARTRQTVLATVQTFMKGNGK